MTLPKFLESQLKEAGSNSDLLISEVKNNFILNLLRGML